MSETLVGQVALVTGASRGIGRQISIDLAAAGAYVVLSARNSERLIPVEREIRGLGGRCERVTLDVTDQPVVEAAVEETVTKHGRIDLLVNNAGIAAGSENPWDLPVEEWWAIQEVNVKGSYICTQAVMRHMTKQRAGRIIDVGSMVGTYPDPGASPYATSKAALFRWNSCLAEGAKAFGVSVFIISPGLVATDMTDIPQFADVPDDQWVPIEKTGTLVVALASGKADVLAGRFIHALDDLQSLVEQADKIVTEDLQTLSMQTLHALF